MEKRDRDIERLREEKLVSIDTLKKDLQERLRVKDAEHQRNLEQVPTPSKYRMPYGAVMELEFTNERFYESEFNKYDIKSDLHTPRSNCICLVHR